MHLYFFAGNCTENLSRKTEGAELLLPGLLSHGIPVLFTGSGLRIAAVFCIAIYFVFISAPGNEEKRSSVSVTVLLHAEVKTADIRICFRNHCPLIYSSTAARAGIPSAAVWPGWIRRFSSTGQNILSSALVPMITGSRNVHFMSLNKIMIPFLPAVMPPGVMLKQHR